MKEQWNTIHDGVTLKDYILRAKREYEDHLVKNPAYGIPFEDEDLVNTILDWHSMVGEFTETEYQYLEQGWDLTKDDIEFLTQED